MGNSLADVSMGSPKGEGRSRVSVRNRPGRERWRKSRRSGVSDVVATIILLALTVTLFAAIFAFVTSFPSPPAQNSNQFQAKLLYNSTGSGVVGINITHLAGPVVPGTALVYVKSAYHTTGCPFSTPKTVASGIPSSNWNLGQVWSATFASFPGCGGTAYTDPLPDNVTIYVVSATQLLFSVILPGQQIVVAPSIVSAWTSPTTPVASTAFRVYAVTTGYLGTAALYVTIPGVTSGPQKMWLNKTTGDWQYNASGVAGGSYSGFVNVTNAYGQTAAAGISFTVTAVGVTPLSVAPSIQPTPALNNTQQTLVATVTNSGSTSATISTVSFWVNWSATGAAAYGLCGTSNCTSPTQWPISGTITQSVVNSLSSVTVLSSKVWVPTVVGVYNITVRVTFTSGTAIVGWAPKVSVGRAFTASVSASPPVVPKSTNSTIIITLTNFGPLTGTTANITVFVNSTASGTPAEGTFTVGPTGKGWATTASGTAIGAYSTITAPIIWKSPSTGGIVCTVTVLIHLTNSGAWGASTNFFFKVTTTVTG